MSRRDSFGVGGGRESFAGGGGRESFAGGFGRDSTFSKETFPPEECSRDSAAPYRETFESFAGALRTGTTESFGLVAPRINTGDSFMGTLTAPRVGTCESISELDDTLGSGLSERMMQRLPKGLGQRLQGLAAVPSIATPKTDAAASAKTVLELDLGDLGPAARPMSARPGLGAEAASSSAVPAALPSATAPRPRAGLMPLSQRAKGTR